ncbi:MAG: polysaccharide biosynthesis/export family protein [Phycisphaerae bacterium]
MMIGALSVTALVGCSDPRISLDEFVALQNPVVEEGEPEAPPRPGMHPIDRHLVDYAVGRGDVLEVNLTGLQEPMSSNVYRVRVDDKGEVDLPLVGAVKIGGMGVSEAENAIKTAYVPSIVRQLTVNLAITEYETTSVVVTGAVSAPGLVPLRRTERNLLYAVLAAGGVSSAASGHVTLHRIRRPGRQATFDLSDPVQLEAALEQDPLEDGDIVMVGAAQPNTIYVGGLVNRPAPQAYPAGAKVNVLQVLAAAGGLREDVYPLEGTLIRRMPDGKDVRVKLNFGRIKRGKDENITLAAGDILWVPETAGTKILDFFNRNLFIRGGVTITYNASGLEFLNSNARQQSLRGLTLEDQFDPFGFLNQNAALTALGSRPPS